MVLVGEVIGATGGIPDVDGTIMLNYHELECVKASDQN